MKLVQKIALGGGSLGLLVLLFLGPTMLRSSQKQLVTTTAAKTSQTVPTTATGESDSTPPVTGFDPSYFNITPIKQPDGSLQFPSYNIPTPTYTPTTPVTGSLPDPDKCAAARDGIAAVDALYVDEDAQLQQQVTNYQSFLINNGKTYAARGYGPTADEQAADQRAQAAMQTASNKLMSNVRDANNKKASFQQQISQYCWNQ